MWKLKLLFIAQFILVVNGLRLSRSAVLKPFVSGNALKIISGLTNFDESIVRKVAFAASVGGASHVDIACRADLVRAAKSVSSIPVCVSSISPKDFVDAVRAGADMVEVGNFDGFYDCGMEFSANDVLSLAKETRNLLPDIPTSVTIPHTLSIEEQIELGKALECLGVDIIQTEGKVSALEERKGSVVSAIDRARPALASSYALSRAVKVPIMAASGLIDITAPMALAAGARGVGIGTMVTQFKDQDRMIEAVRQIAQAMGRDSHANSLRHSEILKSETNSLY